MPDDLYQRLKERAQENRRSLNMEILIALEADTPPIPVGGRYPLRALKFRDTCRQLMKGHKAPFD